MEYKELIGQMTLEEKASLLSGANFWNTKPIPRLGVPSIMITDGPHGLRKQGGKADHLGLNKSLPATCFPTASALANSWDEALLETVGGLLGDEAAANDVSALCGPGLNIKRDPLCGRNFEYFSEDPYLSGKLAAAMVRGIQAKGVAACPKHYAVNSQETRRMVIDEVVDERALREIYLEGFRRVVQEGRPLSLMSAYNRVNGTFANENTRLLRDILYGEWGFGGVVVTDWGGENDRVQGLIAGNQLEMPSCAGQTDREVVAAVQAGVINEALVDESVDALLRLVYATRPAGKGRTYTDEEHHAAARNAARQCLVLLKNEADTLPLAPGARVAVLGDFADVPRYQGTGSSLINPTRVEGALEALRAEDLDIIGYQPGFKRYGGKSVARQNKAVRLAAQADVVLLFLGLPETGEGECNDRAHMRLPQNQLDLLAALRGTAKRLVAVLASGSPVEMPWAGQADAILYAGLGGQAVGGAVADALVGRHNPCGKLTESWPLQHGDCPAAPWYPGEEVTAEHRESLFVGYRYYDTANVPVLWPFGYGLSYTRFAYGGLSFESDTVRFTVKNTGPVAGAEVAQVYVGKTGGSGVFRPEKELKGFARVFLQPGEERQLQVTLDGRAFQYFHTGQNAWAQEGGQYQISVGASCRDIRLACTTEKSGDGLPSPYAAGALPAYFAADAQNVGAEEFEALLGRKLPPHCLDKNAPLGYNDTIGQGQYKRGFAHFLYNVVRFARRLCLMAGQRVAANNVMFAMHMPYRHLARMTGGIIDMPMLDGILVMANGRFFKGLGATWRAWRAKRKAGL